MAAAWRQQAFGWYARVCGHWIVVRRLSVRRPATWIWYARGVEPAKSWGPYADLATAQIAAETWAETHPRRRSRDQRGPNEQA